MSARTKTPPAPGTVTAERIDAAQIAARIERAWCLGVISAESRRLLKARKVPEAKALEVVWERIAREGT